MRRIGSLAFFACAVLPPLGYLAWHVVLYADRFPADDFFFPLHTLLVRNVSLPSFIFQLYGNHRLTTEMFVTYFAQHGRFWLLTYLPLLAGTVNMLLISLLHMRSVETRSLSSWILLLTSAILSLSLVYWHAWSFPFLACLFLVITGMLGATHAITTPHRTPRHALLAAGWCLFATLSIDNGLYSWLCVLPLVWDWSKHARWRDNLRRSAPWLAGFVLCTAIYVLQIRARPGVPPLEETLREPLAIFVYFLQLVGGALWPGATTPAGWIGATMVLLACGAVFAVFRANKALRTRTLPWISIMVFCLGTQAVIVVSRLTISSPTTVRYRIYSALLSVALLHVWYLLAPRGRILIATLCLVITGAQLHESRISTVAWQLRSRNILQGAACFAWQEAAPNACLSQLSTRNIGFVRTLGPVLAARGLIDSFALPSDVVFQKKKMATGAVERMEPFSNWHHSGTLLSGWALEEPCAPARHIIITQEPGHRPLAHTTATIKRTQPCSGTIGWSVQLDGPPQEGVAAWVFDTKSQTLHRIPDTR